MSDLQVVFTGHVLFPVGHIIMSTFQHTLSSCVTVPPTFLTASHQCFCSFLSGSHYDISPTLYSIHFCQDVTVSPTFSTASHQRFCLFSVDHITMSPSHRTVMQPATVRQTCSCQCAIKTRRCIFPHVMPGACLVRRMVW